MREVASIHFMIVFSHFRCMKFWMTRFAFTTAMPKAVTRVIQRSPVSSPISGPATLMRKSTTSTT